MSIPRNLGNFADNVNTNGKVEVTGINATGTPSGSTALLGNGTWGTVTTAPAGSTGQIQYNNGGAFGAISDGTSGQLLTSAGSGSAPTWATPAGGGSLILIQSVTGSGVDTIDVTGNFSSTYKYYKLYVTGTFTASNVAILIRYYINGTLSTGSAYYSTGVFYNEFGASFTSGGPSTAVDTFASGQLNTLEVTLSSPNSGTNRNAIYVLAQASYQDATKISTVYGYNGSGSNPNLNITGLRFTTFGNNGTWTAKLYGIKES